MTCPINNGYVIFSNKQSWASFIFHKDIIYSSKQTFIAYIIIINIYPIWYGNEWGHKNSNFSQLRKEIQVTKQNNNLMYTKVSFLIQNNLANKSKQKIWATATIYYK